MKTQYTTNLFEKEAQFEVFSSDEIAAIDDHDA